MADYIISAAPWYQDGTTGPETRTTVVTGSRPCAADLGEWIARQAERIGTRSADGSPCDAINLVLTPGDNPVVTHGTGPAMLSVHTRGVAS